MNKEIKDYLHLYLGCEIVGTGKKPGSKHYTLVGLTIDGGYLFKTIPEGFSIDLGSDWKPILRSLSDMTEEEKKDVVLINYNVSATFKEAWIEEGGVLGFITSGLTGGGRIDLFASNPETFLYLLSHHFDLFGLIESGLAIDKTKLNSK